MASLDDIPRNVDGIALPCRLRHVSPTFQDGFPGAVFVDGETVDPVTSPALERLVSALGDQVEIIMVDEPRRDQPAQAPPTARLAPTPGPASEPEPEPPTPSLPDDLDALRAIAEARGIDIDGRWKARRIKQAIMEASC